MPRPSRPIPPSTTSVRVELIDDHFRVYIDDVIELDFDIAPGDLIAPGADLAGLISFNGPASIDRFDVAQALPPSFEDTFDDDNCVAWLPGCGPGGWQVVGDPGRLEPPTDTGPQLQTLNTSLLPSLPAAPSSFELSVRVVPHEDDQNDSWAGVFLRRAGPFWTSSYLVFLKSNGDVGLRRPSLQVEPATVAIDPVAGADLTVRLVGDRITVSVDHCQVFDEDASQLAAVDLGLASFRVASAEANASFDDVRLTILPD